MPSFLRVASLSALVGLALSFVPAAAADNTTLLGVSKDWSAFQATTSDGKMCFAQSKPKSTLPKKAARDAILFMISDWPGRNVKSELEIVPGYQYKDGEPVYAEIGTTKIEFFTRNDNGVGTAWVKDAGEENKLVNAMRTGSTITVTGVSKRGTKTKDTYSLGGLAAMLDKVHDACSK